MIRPSHISTRALLEELLARRILVLDGSMGALIYSKQPTEEFYCGQRFRNHPVPLRNCTDIMVLSQPDFIEGLHREYLEAGADIIETNTFYSNGVGLVEFDMEPHTFELNRAGAEVARRAADEFTRRTPDRPRFVAGSIGPSNKT